MTTKINGTNTAASPAITGADTDTGLSFGTDTVNINTGGTTRATIDSNGRLGIGTTSPSSLLELSGSGNATLIVNTGNNSGDNSQIAFGDSADADVGFINYDHGTNAMQFKVNASERARINSSGHFLVGVTGNPSTNGFGVLDTYQSTTYLQIAHNTSGAEYSYINFTFNGSVIGKIAQNNAANAVSYNTSSDYRLKENVVSISDGITRLKTLKPSRFNFKNDTDTTVDGFLAHEVTAVPEAITGTKDEVDSDGNPVYQGIDQSKLVPLLTAALQEAIAKIETLETKVAALEAA